MVVRDGRRSVGCSLEEACQGVRVPGCGACRRHLLMAILMLLLLVVDTVLRRDHQLIAVLV